MNHFLVPSILVPNVRMATLQSLKWWAVSWNPIPDDLVNGVLLGYRITYQMTYKSGSLQGGELKGGSEVVDALTYYYRAHKDIENYATYQVTVAGFTVAGDGPSEPMDVGMAPAQCLFLSMSINIHYFYCLLDIGDGPLEKKLVCRCKCTNEIVLSVETIDLFFFF